MCVRRYLLVRYLQGGEDGGGDDNEKPEVHVEELTDHVGHVGRKDQQEQTQRHGSEVFPQTPAGTDKRRRSASSGPTWTFCFNTFSQVFFLVFKNIACPLRSQ